MILVFDNMILKVVSTSNHNSIQFLKKVTVSL